jgi:hypothetical protein
MEVMPDYVHLFVEGSPTICVMPLRAKYAAWGESACPQPLVKG